MEQLQRHIAFANAALPLCKQGPEGGNPPRILVITPKSHLLPQLERVFPGSPVRLETQETILQAPPNLIPDPERYDYIDAAGEAPYPCDPGELYGALVNLLGPGGVISCGVYGESRYYGLLMLAQIVAKIAPPDYQTKCWNSNSQKIKKEMAQSIGLVISALPENHPAFDQKDFIQRLIKGEHDALERLMTLEPSKLFTASALLEAVPRWGGEWVKWLCPREDNRLEKVGGGDIWERLRKLPEPAHRIALELVTAAPREHFFLMKGCRKTGQ